MLKKLQKRWRIGTAEGNKKIALNKEEKKLVYFGKSDKLFHKI